MTINKLTQITTVKPTKPNRSVIQLTVIVDGIPSEQERILLEAIHKTVSELACDHPIEASELSMPNDGGLEWS